MARSTKPRPRRAPPPGGDDVRSILGDIDDIKVAAILALKPTVADLEQAKLWAAGAGEPLGAEGRPLAGTVAQIVEILASEEEEEPEEPPAAG